MIEVRPGFGKLGLSGFGCLKLSEIQTNIHPDFDTFRISDTHCILGDLSTKKQRNEKMDLLKF